MSRVNYKCTVTTGKAGYLTDSATLREQAEATPEFEFVGIKAPTPAAAALKFATRYSAALAAIGGPPYVVVKAPGGTIEVYRAEATVTQRFTCREVKL